MKDEEFIFANRMLAEARKLASEMLAAASTYSSQMIIEVTKFVPIIIVNPTIDQVFWHILVPNLQERKTGEDWADLFNITVMEPDGWRRHDLSFSDTKITLFDFIEFTMYSVCRRPKNGNCDRQRTISNGNPNGSNLKEDHC